MNRIIIVGNGFDLAHKLKTKYEDFLVQMFNSAIERFKKEPNKQPLERLFKINTNKNGIKINEIEEFTNIHQIRQCFENEEDKNFLFYEGELIKTLIGFLADKNWVDIENEFYKMLIKRARIEKFEEKGQTMVNPYERWKTIEQFNLQFEDLKNELKSYLKNEQDSFISDLNGKYTLNQRILHLFTKPPVDFKHYFKQINIDDTTIPKMSEVGPNKVWVINFNYTSVLEHYNYNRDLIKVLNIHGDLSGEIIFGFGNEFDENYGLLEEMTDSGFMKNIKFFQYLRDKNHTFKRLESAIDSEDFDVYVWGHSCGQSDGTLLKKIMDNPKCNSINVFYHNENQYFDVSVNISKHFTVKSNFMEKMAPIEFCEQLPQIIKK